MQKKLQQLSVFALLLITFGAYAEGSTPWYTGPLLAPSGKTIPAGHVNFEPYGFYTVYPDQFRNIEAVPVVTVGLTSFLDLQGSIPYDYSWERNQHASNIGDLSLGLGFQILRQENNPLLPDLRLVIQEVFPTGKFENLNPNGFGTDQTGSGAYQTSIGFNFQRVTTMPNGQSLRSRFAFVATAPGDVRVHGNNVFGGVTETDAIVEPGHGYSVDLAFEYALNQHWVPVFEAVYAHSQHTGVSGNPGFTPGGLIASIGGPEGDHASLAPALEYNFTSNIGLIGGVWFSVTGPHAAKFVATSLALNCYF